MAVGRTTEMFGPRLYPWIFAFAAIELGFAGMFMPVPSMSGVVSGIVAGALAGLLMLNQVVRPTAVPKGSLRFRLIRASVIIGTCLVIAWFAPVILKRLPSAGLAALASVGDDMPTTMWVAGAIALIVAGVGARVWVSAREGGGPS